jgi:small-conductance mechanosensitive channel
LTAAPALAPALAVTLGAALAHYGIGRARRRLPLWLARRRGAPAPAADALVALLALGLRGAAWLAAAVYLATRFPALGMPLGAGRRLVEMAIEMPLFSLGMRALTALDLLLLPIALLALWLGAGMLTRVLRAQLLGGSGLASGAAESVASLARYALAFLGGLVLLQAYGVDVRSIALLGGVLGVGIGFGLQSLAGDFVSGVLIHLGRPIQPGDFVAVGDLAGTVQRVGACSTAIVTADRVAILVPNARFLQTAVVNWSHGDPVSRVRVPVGVASGADVERVRRALLEAARGHAGVLREPHPEVELRRLGESSLDLELLVWTRDPRTQSRLISDLNFRVEASLRRHGIPLPSPQYDVHLRSPRLERVLGAHEERLGVAPEAAAEAASAEAPTGEVPHREPEAWDEAELDALARRLRGPGGVALADRRHLLAVHRRCFVGREAVDWLVRHEALSREEAVAVGERLRARGRLRHVLDEHGFRDGHFFYRFREDEAQERASARDAGAPPSPEAAHA